MIRVHVMVIRIFVLYPARHNHIRLNTKGYDANNSNTDDQPDRDRTRHKHRDDQFTLIVLYVR